MKQYLLRWIFGKYGIGVFIDLKKAFDTVNHEILLEKIKTYGIRGKALELLQSYLLNRKQYVVYNGKASCYLNIKCEVPQGSILGPTLFLLYINDLRNISKLLKFIIFADDTNIFYSSENIKTLEKTMNDELAKLVSWFKANKLSLNINKTNFMMFTKKRNDRKVNISIDNIKISEVKETKFLGVIIDNNLCWTPHIESVYKKIYKSLGVIYRVKDKLPTKSLHLLYCSLILPYLSYCSEVWGNTHKTKLNKIRTIQKKAIRFICKARYRDLSEPLFKQMKCLKFDDIVHTKTCMVMYKAYNNQLPNNIQSIFTKVNTIHRYSTRQQGNLHVQSAKTTLKQKCISHIGIKTWNNLDDKIKSSRNINSFQKKIKNNLLNAYNAIVV